MGNPSTQTLLGVKEGITRVRGSWREYEIAPGRRIPALPTLHPAYLLRTPSAKRGAWLDLRALKRAIERHPLSG
jgi:DNA polymerase